jgi:hypothetical protein
MTKADAHPCGYPKCKTQPTKPHVFRHFSRYLCAEHGKEWLKVVAAQQAKPKVWRK